MYYLLKTEPSGYSFADLRRDGETVWDGVSNPVAVKHLRMMKPGDQLVIYHTGNERRVVGTASVLSVMTDDPKNPHVKIRVGAELVSPVALTDIKANKLFAESPLLRQGRLSVVPLSDEQFKFLTA